MTDTDYGAKHIHDIIREMNSDPVKGLSGSAVQERTRIFGKNIVKARKRKNPLSVFVSQFKDLMTWILIISSVISFAVEGMRNSGDVADGVIILVIVFVNAVIGTVQELKAEKAVHSLETLTAPKALVIRTGRKQSVPAEEVVPGDIVLLEAGNICPADIRLISSVDLSCDESALTGESEPSQKSESFICSGNESLSERKNILYAGSSVCTGNARGVVIKTGISTEIGKIAAMISAEKAPETPLQKKLNATGKILAVFVLVVCLVIFLFGIARNSDPIEMLLLSISLAVAAVPEGLTAVVTVVLSLGIKHMAEKKAIVRKLSAVETLGSTQVICSDKTGTLTQNKMTVTAVASADGILSMDCEESRFLLTLAALCNNAELSNNKFKGSPTESALLSAYLGTVGRDLSAFKRIGEIAFSSERKMMTTAHNSGSEYLVVSKGTPERILGVCSFCLSRGDHIPLSSSLRKRIHIENEKLAGDGLRIIAVAKKDCVSLPENDSEIESDLVFCGLIGLSDPPKKEAKQAVAECIAAGIKPVMITGDQLVTAKSIAKQLDIYTEGDSVITGREIKNMDEKRLVSYVSSCSVFAAVAPEDKVKIVKAYQRSGFVTAMTGDGVNDAPALKTADIGCAMGRSGTEVARESADIILSDDNFATIVSAVKEGRGIFQNIRKTIHFLISCNFGEILVVFLAFALWMPSPLYPVQLLWINLVTDSLPAIAIGISRNNNNIFGPEFLKTSSAVFTKDMIIEIVTEGALIGALALLGFTVGRYFFGIDIGRTMCFAVLCLSQLAHSFNVSSDVSIFKNKIGNFQKISALCCSLLVLITIAFPPLGVFFHTVTLSFLQWIIVLLLSLCPILVCETEKFIFNFSRQKK